MRRAEAPAVFLLVYKNVIDVCMPPFVKPFSSNNAPCLPAARPFLLLLLLIQGLLRAPKESIPTEVCLVKLWRHECCRVFADKLTTLEDRSAFLKELDHQTSVLGRAVLGAPQVTLLLREIKKKRFDTSGRSSIPTS